ncbi:hypothetical protein [Candidatus Methanoperedens nitratireducens]|uniref:hypothetical protein n=1 Tax=Candidatus Methanoperedens nitratireducens TaxID=1392998 RepID=UPI001C542E9C|nr:hypothetical protein [Candidatus Methanoperedens nitroreducens]
MLVVAASALGCLGNKEKGKVADISTQAPASPAQTQQPAPQAANTQVTASPAQTSSGTSPDDLFGTENELTSVDSLVNDLDADITFSDSI